jgi:hypothetical protein
MQERTSGAAHETSQDDISLKPYFDTIWRYRRVIVVGLAFVSLVYLSGVVALFLLTPVERIGTIQFRLLFEGAEEGKYPNQDPFSPTEVVAAPVVQEVYRTNDLQRYGTYKDFKDGLFIQQSNFELDRLVYEYQGKLADTRLTPVDRARIEADYQDKRRSIKDPTFNLSLRRSERFTGIPRDVAEKTLGDTVAAWSRQAELNKGALRYRVPILTSKILSRSGLDTDDYLVSADLLRAKATRIIQTITEMEKLPGALTIRAGDGFTLPEIRANLEDSIRFDLEPLLGIVRSEGLTKNPRLLSVYASNQAFQIKLEKDEAAARTTALQDSLSRYMNPRGSQAAAEGSAVSGKPTIGETAVIPQVSESFIDRLVKLSSPTQEAEVEYRQKLTDELILESKRMAALDKELKYYQGLVEALHGIGNSPRSSLELVNLFNTRSANALAVITKATDQLSQLYSELSAQNLNPESRLYILTTPYSEQTEHAVSRRGIALGYMLVMLVTLIVAPIACIVHDVTRSRRAAAVPRQYVSEGASDPVGS